MIFAILCFLPERASSVMNDSIFLLLLAMGIFLFFRRKDSLKRAEGKKISPGRLCVQLVSRYSFSVLMIHWFMLFMVVDKHFHLDARILEGPLAGLAVVFQSFLALLCSLLFAVIYDNTVVLLAERVVRKLCRSLHHVYKGRRKGRIG